jgi:transposase
VLEYIETTADKAQACQLFKVGIATIYRWIARKKRIGNVDPSPKKAYKKKIDDQNLVDYIEKNPDHFLSEIATHFNTSLQRLKLTRNKSHALQGKKCSRQGRIYQKK